LAIKEHFSMIVNPISYKAVGSPLLLDEPAADSVCSNRSTLIPGIDQFCEF
jgi:hypothetical protein